MGVVSHSYGGLGGGSDEGGGWKACQIISSVSGDAGTLPKCEGRL